MEEGETTNLLKIEFAECGDIKEEALQDDENVSASSSAVGASSISTIVKAEPLDIIDKNEDDKIPLQEDPNLGDFLQVDLAEPVEIKVEPVVTAAENDRVTDEPMNEDQGGEAKKNLGKNQDLPVAGSSGRSSVQEAPGGILATLRAKLRSRLGHEGSSDGKNSGKTSEMLSPATRCTKKPNSGIDIPSERLEEELELKRRIWACDQCTYTAKNMLALKSHVESHRVKAFACDKCKFSSARRINLIKHKKNVHAVLIKRYFCQMCPYQTRHPLCLSMHVKKHTGPFLRCELCPYLTVYKRSMKQHLRMHADGVPGPDPNRRVGGEPELRVLDIGKVPEDAQQDASKPLCNRCSTRFNDLQALHLHKPIQPRNSLEPACKECSAKLRDSVQKSPEPVHSGKSLEPLPPFACKRCTARFRDRHGLQRHKLTHSDDQRPTSSTPASRIASLGLKVRLNCDGLS